MIVHIVSHRSSSPVMEAHKRGDSLGDAGWLTEEEEDEEEEADRCLNLSPEADEINPSSKSPYTHLASQPHIYCKKQAVSSTDVTITRSKHPEDVWTKLQQSDTCWFTSGSSWSCLL